MGSIVNLINSKNFTLYDENRIAFFYGPVLLNAVLAENPDPDVLEDNPNVPQLNDSRENILDALQPVKDESLHFRAEGVGRIQNEDTGEWETTDLYFKPYYQTVDELYTIYMDIQS